MALAQRGQDLDQDAENDAQRRALVQVCGHVCGRCCVWLHGSVHKGVCASYVLHVTQCGLVCQDFNVRAEKILATARNRHGAVTEAEYLLAVERHKSNAKVQQLLAFREHLLEAMYESWGILAGWCGQVV